jgi:hypothetical protein
MKEVDLGLVLTKRPQPSTNGNFVPGDVRDVAFEQATSSLWEQLSKSDDSASVAEFEKALDYVKVIRRIDGTRNQGAYLLAQTLAEFADQQMWKRLGCENLSDFFNDREICAIPRSTGYRYIAVGHFIDSFDITSIDFEDEFYAEHGVPRLAVTDVQGNPDDQATREANRLVSRIRYMHLGDIAGALNKKRINSGQVRELMAKSILLSDDEFKNALKEAQGQAIQATPFEELMNAGFKPMGIVIPFESGTDEANYSLGAELRALASAAEQGALTEIVGKIKAGEAVSATSKKVSVKFVESEGFKVVVL